MKKPNQFDSRNRDWREIYDDLMKLGKQCRLTIVGSHSLDAVETAGALRESWDDIVEMIGFKPKRIITGCRPVGAEKAARLAAKDLTGKLAVVAHRPDLVHSAKDAEMFMNISLSNVGDALLILAKGKKPVCENLRAQFMGWQKKIYQVQVG